VQAIDGERNCRGNRPERSDLRKQPSARAAIKAPVNEIAQRTLRRANLHVNRVLENVDITIGAIPRDQNPQGSTARVLFVWILFTPMDGDSPLRLPMGNPCVRHLVDGVTFMAAPLGLAELLCELPERCRIRERSVQLAL